MCMRIQNYLMTQTVQAGYDVANRTSLPKVIWEEGRVAAKVYTYAVKSHQWGAPNSPQKYPFPWTDPQTPLLGDCE